MTSNDRPTVLIAGAGIGGLTAALTLHARAMRPTVVDSAQELRELGVGINLLPHAVRELHRLGLGDDLAKIAAAPAAIAFFDKSGHELFREPRGIEGGYGWPQYSVHRGKLQMLLLAAVGERLGDDAVVTGAKVTEFDEHQDRVVVDTAAGDFSADVLIGADGIHSTIRRQLHPGPDPLMWSGIRMWRGTSPLPPFLDGRTMAIVHGGDDVDLVTYPIGDDLVNWVVQVPESTPGPFTGDAQWTARASKTEVCGQVEDWTLDWLDVRQLIESSETIFGYPMVDRDPLPHWGTQRVTLLGDAAHPMYPVGANGGSQSIVDAAVLATELADSGVAGLQSYEEQRRTETAEVVVANRAMHTASTTSADDLRRATRKYRDDTLRSTRS